MTARSRLSMAVACAGVATLAAIAAALGVFAHGSGDAVGSVRDFSDPSS